MESGTHFFDSLRFNTKQITDHPIILFVRVLKKVIPIGDPVKALSSSGDKEYWLKKSLIYACLAMSCFLKNSWNETKIMFNFFHTSHFVTRQSSSINLVSFLYLIEYDWLSRHKWHSCSEFCPQTIEPGCWSKFYGSVLTDVLCYMTSNLIWLCVTFSKLSKYSRFNSSSRSSIVCRSFLSVISSIFGTRFCTKSTVTANS